MRNTTRWALLAVGLMVLVVAFYVAKLDRDLGVSVNGEINRRFVVAAAQVQVLDGGIHPAKP